MTARGPGTLRSARRFAAQMNRRIDRLRSWLKRHWAPETSSPKEHWLRQVLNRSIEERIDALDRAGLDAVEISGAAHAHPGWKSFTTLDYPDFDLCAPTLGRGPFDVVVCEQVLEHVADPWRAAQTLHDLCKPGGLVIVSTPFLVPVHELPAYGLCDYWRFTPRGLATLLESAGLTVEAVDCWGNRDCVAANLEHWAAYRSWHSLRNEVDIPLQVWAFSRRPDN